MIVLGRCKRKPFDSCVPYTAWCVRGSVYSEMTHVVATGSEYYGPVHRLVGRRRVCDHMLRG